MYQNQVTILDKKYVTIFCLISLLDKKYVTIYIKIVNMRKQSTWGGAIEIQCVYNIWKMRVLVEDVRSQMKRATIEFIPVNNIYDKTINLKWSGGHYERICLQIFKSGLNLLYK